MCRSPALRCFFAVVLLTVYTNCVLSHGAEAQTEMHRAMHRAKAFMLNDVAALDAGPLEPDAGTPTSKWPIPCSNESSCICHGATLAEQFLVTDLFDTHDSVGWVADLAAQLLQPTGIVYSPRELAVSEACLGPPLSAQRLRSQIQVYLI